MFGIFKKKEVKISTVGDEREKSLSLVQVEGKERERLIEHFSKFYEVDPGYPQNGGTISPKSILSIVGGAGASAAGTSALSSQLFIATANPATLMQLGGGVGSAVMGTSGIVGQAAFLPAAGAVMPVALPLIAFQAVSTLTVLNQFKVVNKKLDILERNIRKILQRDEASFAGDILYSIKQLDLIEQQFQVSKKFTNEMIHNLSQVQSKVGPAFERYRILYESEKLDVNSSNSSRKQKHCDSHFLVAFSILELRIYLLKIKVAVQDAPEQLDLLVKNFKDKSEEYKQLWERIQQDPNLAKKVSQELSEAIEEMNTWQRNMPSWLGGKRKLRKQLAKKSSQFHEHAAEIDSSLDKLVESGHNIVPKSENEEQQVILIYWEDHLGQHSIYVNDLGELVKDKNKAA
jgi:hypothetical protein